MTEDNIAIEFDNGSDDQNRKPDEVYKKWFKAGDLSGFLSVRMWADAGLLNIDIGQTKNNELASHAAAYVPVVKLLTYLRAVTNGYAPNLYKDEVFVHYGGSMNDGNPVSRIFKIEYWKNDPSAFHWKIGHFRATRTAQGAYTPNMKEEIRRDSIKVARIEMAEITSWVEIAVASCISADPNWVYQKAR